MTVTSQPGPASRPVFLVAPDKFKGTLSAAEAAEAIAEGLRAAAPDAEIRMLPFADGGEGTVDAVLAAGAARHSTRVSGPLGKPVDATWAMLAADEEPTAVLESAAANGLAQLTPSPDTALDASSAGVGELIRAALDAGAVRIVLGLGGSASTDGGSGALRALGARTLDADGAEVQGGGRELARIATLDLSGLDPRLAATRIVLAADVANPMSGPTGAARVFAPQKGADAAAVAALDAGLAAWQEVLRAATGVDLAIAGGDGSGWGGAAGGLGGGLRAALGAEAASGVEVVAELLDVDAALDGVSVLVVGEGSIDEQTALGKAAVGLARRARARGIRTLAIAGRSTLAPTALAAEGIDRIVTATELGGEAAIADARHWVSEAAYFALTGLRRPARLATVPQVPTPYFHFLRTPRNRWWRTLLYLVAAAVAWVLVSTVAAVVATLVDIGTGRTTAEALAQGRIVFTPGLFLANNLSLAALGPIAYLLQWALTRQRPRWLSSVAGRFRWRWFAVCSGIVGVLWGATFVVQLLVPGQVPPGKLSPDWLFMLLAVLLTTPLQAAGEEFGFRGALVRGVASWIPLRWLGWGVGTAVSSLVFMSLHGAGDPWLNLFYLSFGIASSVLAWRTGGLEASVAVHVINNLIQLVPVALFADIGGAFDRQAGAGDPSVLIYIGLMVAAIVSLSFAAKRMRIARLGPPGTLTGTQVSAGSTSDSNSSMPERS